MKRILLFVLTMLCLVRMMAQNPISARDAIIVERSRSLSAEVLSADRQAEGCDTALVSAYLFVYEDVIDREALRQIGVQVTLDMGDVMTVRMPLSTLQMLSQVDGVRYVQTALGASQMLDGAGEDVGIGRLRTDDCAYTGRGVIVGIVDSGFDYLHEAFRNADGELRIVRVWEQGTEDKTLGEAPTMFGYGVELTSEEAILEAGGDIRNNTHGTHVACCAAGASAYLSGMAPDAEIVLVSMTAAGQNNVNITNAIQYIFAYADEVGKPCVVNLSLGSNAGPHDGTSPFDIVADRLQGAGRLIVGAAGNNGQNNFHIRRDGQRQPLSTFIHYLQAPSRSNEGEVDVWADEMFEAQLAVYKISDGSLQTRVDIDLTATTEVGLDRNVTGCFVASYELNPLNQRHHLVLRNEVTAIRNGYAVAIEVKPTKACTLDIRADGNYLGLTSRNMEGFAAPSDRDATVCEIGGTAKRITTVGAYATRVDYSLYGDATVGSINETLGEICSFSGYGPTDDGRMKPELTAPGAFINAARSQYDATGAALLSYRTDDGHEYGFMQGTSMASPIVAGIVACWLQAYPQMTPEELHEVVRRSSRNDEHTGLPVGRQGSAPSNRWGYGKIDAAAGINECLLLSGIVVPQTSDNAHIYNLAGQRVSTPREGIYIRGSKKYVFIKF